MQVLKHFDDKWALQKNEEQEKLAKSGAGEREAEERFKEIVLKDLFLY
jgi:hypothetical protein